MKKDGKMYAVKTIPLEKLYFKYKDTKDYLKEVKHNLFSNYRCK
jgi:hypothetical protein